jgi:AsmA protein
LSGDDMTQLAAATKAKGRITGKVTVNLKATARGADGDDILKTLNGHVDASLANGALEGVDLGYELALAQSLLDSHSGTAVKDTNRTAFQAFKDSATITNGVAETNDLTIVSPVLNVSGKGSVNLRNSALDLNLVASFLKSAGASALEVPVKVTGTYADPTVQADVAGLAKAAVKDKIKDVLKKNGLEGLFGH